MINISWRGTVVVSSKLDNLSNKEALSIGKSFSAAITVYGQTKKRGLKVLLKESLYVLVHIKPVVSAFKVVSAAKAHRHDVLDPSLELAIIKIVEM